VNVTHHFEKPLAAACPQATERLTVENADPVIVGMRVEIIVVYDVSDDGAPAAPFAKKEYT
jgi:hypothetical protein